MHEKKKQRMVLEVENVGYGICEKASLQVSLSTLSLSLSSPISPKLFISSFSAAFYSSHFLSSYPYFLLPQASISSTAHPFVSLHPQPPPWQGGHLFLHMSQHAASLEILPPPYTHTHTPTSCQLSRGGEKKTFGPKGVYTCKQYLFSV